MAREMTQEVAGASGDVGANGPTVRQVLVAAPARKGDRSFSFPKENGLSNSILKLLTGYFFHGIMYANGRSVESCG
jgi:hypothetical protein